jgi:superfamily II DNA or RNA helicase
MGFATYNIPRKIKSYTLDGNILTVPRGVLGWLHAYFDNSKTKIDLIDDTVEVNPVKFKPDSEFQLRRYQKEAVESLVSGNGGVVRGPCGSGKTIILLMAIARLGQPALVIVHNKALLDQWCSSVRKLFHIEPLVFSGTKKKVHPIPGQPYIMVATQQSLYSTLKKQGEIAFFSKFGTVVGDECFDRNTKILMKDGTEKDIGSICVGDSVSHGGKVLRIFRRKYSGPAFSFFGKNIVTPNHPIATPKGWISIKDLKPEDRIYVIHNHSTLQNLRSKHIEMPRKIEVQDLEVFNFETGDGVYLANGILVHNCHHWAANTFYSVANNIPAKYRLGASADERRKDNLEFLIYETFGEVKYKIKRDELIQDKKLLPLRIEFVATQYVDEVYLSCRKEDVTVDWVMFISLLSQDEQRKFLVLLHACRLLGVPYEETNGNSRESDKLISSFNFIKSSHVSVAESIFSAPRYTLLSMDSKKSKLALSDKNFIYSESERKNHQILILSDRVEACKDFFLMFEQLGIPSGLLLGNPENKDELMRTIAGLQTGSIRVGIGTTVADEGLDIPPLTHVICTCPVHQHPKRMEQMVGRTARICGNKEFGTCVYLWDRKIFPHPEEEREANERKWIARVAGAINAREIYVWDRLPGKKKRENMEIGSDKKP